MDWFSWLSKTSLEPSLVYEYGVTFAWNELQEEDISYFNHDFLMSMGISVAKHRLEIIKLARQENRRKFQSLSRIISAITNTKIGLLRYARKLILHGDCSRPVDGPKMSQLQVQWKEPMIRKHGNTKEDKEERLMISNWSHKESGPLDARERSCKVKSGSLDRRMQEKLTLTSGNRKVVSGPLHEYPPQPQQMMLTNRSLKFSRPQDGKAQTITNTNPMISRPLVARAPSPIPHNAYSKENMGNADGIDTLWATLFQDMKPT